MADESASLGPKDLGPPSEDSPSVQDLEQLLNTGSPSCHHADEVWPNLFLGDQVTAHNKEELRRYGITHILNAAHSAWGSKGNQTFYGSEISYYGIAAEDDNLSLADALEMLLQHRAISPNRGFLKQLQDLDLELCCKRSLCQLL
ncbi:Dual specificity protein phosphatase 13 isoform MDSP, partial [Ophiophagus hannah]